jgi:hypothetical protein
MWRQLNRDNEVRRARTLGNHPRWLRLIAELKHRRITTEAAGVDLGPAWHRARAEPPRGVPATLPPAYPLLRAG